MKTYPARFLALFVVLGLAVSAMADETVRVVWICNINDGKSMDDVRAANSAWVKYMHTNVDREISSTILTPVVGNLENQRFVFADDFPSFEVWNASREAEDTEVGGEIMQALGDSVTCDNNSLYSAEES